VAFFSSQWTNPSLWKHFSCGQNSPIPSFLLLNQIFCCKFFIQRMVGWIWIWIFLLQIQSNLPFDMISGYSTWYYMEEPKEECRGIDVELNIKSTKLQKIPETLELFWCFRCFKNISIAIFQLFSVGFQIFDDENIMFNFKYHAVYF